MTKGVAQLAEKPPTSWRAFVALLWNEIALLWNVIALL